MMTNQIHKWAHMPSPPMAIRALQQCGVLLGHAEHAAHHEQPYNVRYCITTGWCNRPAEAIGLFRRLEVAITFANRRASALRRPPVHEAIQHLTKPTCLARDDRADVIRLRLHQRPALGDSRHRRLRRGALPSVSAVPHARAAASACIRSTTCGRSFTSRSSRPSCSAASAPFLRANKTLALIGIGFTLAAALLGGSRVPVGGDGRTGSWLGLDFFVLNLLLYSAVFIPLERLFALADAAAGVSPPVARRSDVLLRQLAADRNADDPHAASRR